MDLDFVDLPSDNAAPAARAGARFKPKGRPQLKKKPVSRSTSQTTQSKDVTSETIVPESVTINESTSETVVSESVTTSQSTSETIVPESVTVNESISETIVPESVTVNETTLGTLSEENMDLFARKANWKPSILRTCTNVVSEGKRPVNDTEAVHDDPRAQESAVEDFVTPATDENINAQTETIQPVEEECHLDMETLDMVQEEGMTSGYEQLTGKFQPKPRLLDPEIEEPESHYYVDDTDNFTTNSNDSQPMVNVEPRNDFSTDTTFYEETQEEEVNNPQVPIETVPEEARNVDEHDTNNTVIGDTVEAEGSGKKSKKGKSKKAATTRKRKTASEKETNKSTEAPEEKKFKHSTRRQKRNLDKQLLETPDDEIRFLPIKDMLRLVEYREWLEKKEAKGAPAVVTPAQESNNTNTWSNNANAWDNNNTDPWDNNTNAWNSQYYSQDMGVEDEFAMEEGGNEEVNVIKPDSPVNYQTYMKKSARTRWPKEDTQLFYEGIREFGSNLSMVQQLFPERTCRQIKLKFKLEERRCPLKLNDALSSRSKDLTHLKNVMKKLQDEAAAAKAAEEAEYGVEDEDEDGEEAEAETTTDVPNNEEPGKSEELDGGDQCDDGGDDDEFWNSYKNDI